MNSQEKERQISMLSVDYRQIQQRLQKLEGEYRQEVEKVKALHGQIEQEQQKKSILQSEMAQQASELAKLKVKETTIAAELQTISEAKKIIEEEMLKTKRSLQMEQLQMKELQDSLEAEQYFSTLYKTQTHELKEELEETKKINREFEEERASLKHQCQLAVARADSEALARSIAEETVAELEKDKTMKELEHKDLITKHRNDLNAKEGLLNQLRDRELEYKKAAEKIQKEYDELFKQHSKLQDEYQKNSGNQLEIEKLKTKLNTEQLLKQQAVNKLHEIMNRKDVNNTKGKSKISSADLRRKEKDLKKLQQELSQEREKFNTIVLSYQKNIQELQVSFSIGT